MSVDFFFLWPSSPELLSLRLLNAFNIGLISEVFVLGVSVGSGIGEVALATEAGEISALRVFLFSPFFGLHLIFTRNDAN